MPTADGLEGLGSVLNSSRNGQIFLAASFVTTCCVGAAVLKYRCEWRRPGLLLLSPRESILLWFLVGLVCGCFVQFWVLFQIHTVQVSASAQDGLGESSPRVEPFLWGVEYFGLWGLTILAFASVGRKRVQWRREPQRQLDFHDEAWMMTQVFWVVVSVTFASGAIFQLLDRGHADRTTELVFGYWIIATIVVVVVGYVLIWAADRPAAPTVAADNHEPRVDAPDNPLLAAEGISTLTSLRLDEHTEKLEAMGLLERLSEVSPADLQRAGLPLLHARTLLSAVPDTVVQVDPEDQAHCATILRTQPEPLCNELKRQFSAETYDQMLKNEQLSAEQRETIQAMRERRQAKEATTMRTASCTVTPVPEPEPEIKPVEAASEKNHG